MKGFAAFSLLQKTEVSCFKNDVCISISCDPSYIPNCTFYKKRHQDHSMQVKKFSWINFKGVVKFLHSVFLALSAELNCTPDTHFQTPPQPLMAQKNCYSLHIKIAGKWNFIWSQYFRFFSRRYGTKCSGCGQGIAPSDLVRKPRDKVFHLNCFTCCICRKQLSTGEQLYVLDDNKFICKDDYMLGKGSHHHHHMTGELKC